MTTPTTPGASTTPATDTADTTNTADTTPATDTDVVVAGAGIAGLTAALALHARGLSVTVLEAAHELRPLGVGINLQPAAAEALADLGLRDRLEAVAIPTSQAVYLTQDGTELSRRTFSGDARQFSVHRGRLQMMLLDAVTERLPEGSVVTGARVTGVSGDAEGVTVHTGSAGDHRARAVLGADGVHSALRASLHGGDEPYLWEGTTMYRGTCDADSPFLDGRSMVLVYGDDERRFLAYPISAEAAAAGRSLINWVAMVPDHDPTELGDDGIRNIPTDPADVVPAYRGWGFDWLDIEGLIADSSDVLTYPMVDREPLSSWGEGRLTLLGDAAHPMYPIGANGGSQAILDAVSAAAHLAGDDGRPVDDVPAALAAYEEERRPRTTEVVLANRRLNATERGIAEKSPAELRDIARSGRFQEIQEAYARGDFDAV
ncbi:FAD-dependent oxidoreductase [Corynebacterium bovis]|uniref:2-polyprenyl-6-methoxyphenol hydroxylase-like FAD-dependent oxidoreductase n=1 Tax=Corynebacterium bovis DSM 20582 = CIP 54.80 TaxID=927655 RepID=A0A8I0CNI3_9CORY|nr:FAD-dependent oxidoreductase [Corynebacterium bovis]MBB3114961.1 2-polyprenyl-6-methoxyphenol hydroxylase-like FAD-dependent oxidoreductase [Corynebacterium bovis DSM 20582 = CIP 54.80]QQC48048.1 FAD-dependent monooxygenase [Corynebacterium bovis]RRO80815.1 FAD-binding protein [Corynebacterium bovis]RRO81278.1 FAD-binding protein [Corynebacterium bovis]RRO84263.1 FAD-binding protein [Corynebacterium bovis]